MTYKQAMKALDEGKRVRRGADRWFFLTKDPNGTIYVNDPIMGSVMYRRWVFKPSDADKRKRDWEVVE